MSKQTDLLNLTDAITVDSSNNVGIGTSSPSGGKLHITGSNYNDQLVIERTDTSSKWGVGGYTSGGFQVYDVNSGNATRMVIDSSGNLLVGTTNASLGTGGIQLNASGRIGASASSLSPMILNRKTSDGTIIDLRKDGSTVGSIGSASGGSLEVNVNGGILYLARNANGHIEVLNASASGQPRLRPSNDNFVDLGDSGRRFDDIYATNATIQTSDRNEKQDIEALSDAEQRVAVACKGLMRKFRWIDAVAEKGDDARIHFGIIAQDLQDAFTAEGLDAGDYAMFISTTWWETQTDVPAVAAVAEVLDDDGNVVTEAVEAKDAYTRTDTYETLEEAPEGATERTRLGVRYPELLAFIIGAM